MTLDLQEGPKASMVSTRPSPLAPLGHLPWCDDGSGESDTDNTTSSTRLSSHFPESDPRATPRDFFSTAHDLDTSESTSRVFCKMFLMVRIRPSDSGRAPSSDDTTRSSHTAPRRAGRGHRGRWCPSGFSTVARLFHGCCFKFTYL